MTERQKTYNHNKEAKCGDEITCPVCGSVFIKKQWQQAFCRPKCKQKFWDSKGGRHKDPNYHRHYNMKHPHRYLRLTETVHNIRDWEEELALIEYKTNEVFREYIAEVECDADGSWDAHNCSISLAQHLRIFNGDDAW